MASSDLTLTLTLQQVNRERLFQIRDSLKQLYGVTLIINSNSIYDNGSNSDILSSQSGSEILKCVGKQDGHRSFALRAGGTAFSAAATSLHAGAAPEILSSVTLHFQTYGSQENIEMAKNFTRTHLIPSTDYVVRTHPLSQEEFDMVLQSSQNIQTSTSALLSFNPDCLEVTLQGTQNNVTAAGAKVVMLLEQLRDQSDLESNIHVSHGHPFHDNLCLSTFTKKQNDDISKMPCSVAKERITSDCQKNDFSSISTNSYQNRTQGSPTLWNIQPHSPVTVAKSNHSHDTEQDCAYNSNSPTEGNTHMDDLEKTFGLALKEPSFSSSSSSDNESELEDNILTDPRYSKQVEQALKLGYSESHVKTALTKLGPDCNFNDLLSELIKIGASDSVPEDVSSFSSSSSDPQPSSQDHNSRSSGSFVDVNDSSNLRDIIIDGSNVAMSHGKTVFSCKGIQIAVDWFRQRGHKAITVIVPLWRKETSRPDAPITDQHILSELEKEKIVVFTPSRRVQGKRVVCYDDRFILNLAVDTEGIVVSNDVYRDLVSEKEAYRKVVDERLLMYSFVSDRFYPPEDPLGRLGPTLDNFLRKTPAEPTTKPADCPYGKKCTYGNKCRFYHPERGFAPQKSITDTLKEQADLKLQERAKMSEMAEKGKRPKQKLARTKALAPGEPLPFSTVSSTPGVEGSGRREKPKLVHSKSLGPPSKTSGYLDESRRKLEEAEMSGALEKMSLSSESSRASPILQRDITKQMMASADTLFHSSSPVKTGGSKSPRASPAHLTVPKPEQQERYLSGHLLLAKKLSDESTDNNFFSEHTSSPSSTRTSSPVVPASKTMEQKSSANIEPQHGEELGRFGFSPPNMQQTFGSQEQDNIPNLSIFESGPSRQILYSDSGDSGSSGYKYSSIDSPRPTDFVMSSVFLRSPDSGNFSASDPLSHLSHNHTDYPPPQNVQQQFHGYPLLPRADQGHYSQEHPNLRRSFSSTCNVKNVEVHQKLGRRGSAFISAQKEHPVLRPQNSMPGHFSLGPSTLTRQNSTSDPQIHNTFDQAEYPPSGFSPPRKFQDPYPMHTQPHQGDSRQMQLLQQYQLQQQYQQHQQLPFETQHYPRMPQRQDSVILSPQVKQNISPWGEAPSYRNVGHRASLGGQATSSYNPHQSSFSLQNSGHVQYFPASMGERGVMPSNTLSTSPSVPPQMPHYQQPHIFSPPFSPVPRTVSPQSFPQVQYSLPNYPQQPNFSSPHTGQAPPAQPGAQIRQPSPVMTEDAHILPDDPRYSLYYHLSSVFGEAVVRKVMNLNSCVNDPDQLCTLIMKYKEETGR